MMPAFAPASPQARRVSMLTLPEAKLVIDGVVRRAAGNKTAPRIRHDRLVDQPRQAL
jgi:hypothetical protein